MKLPRTQLTIAMLLWLFCGSVYAVEAIADVEAAARRGDVLALMASATIASIGFSAWLVRQYVAQSRESTKAMVEIAGKMDALVTELRVRPCVTKTQELRSFGNSTTLIP